jgi:hypothetical protein
MAFNYNYKPLDYKTAQGQATAQVNPLYQQAIQGVNQQKYANDVQAGQVAAARGLGHSGLAADQLNKIAIAAQGQVGDINAQRATQVAQMASDMVQRDKEYSLQNRSQLYNEYSDNRNYNYQAGRDKIGDQRYTAETAYSHGRDKVADSQWQKSYDYTKSTDNRNYNYQKSTDDRNYNYQKSQDKVANDWKQKEWSQMSPADKARMALQYSYSKKASKGGGGGSGHSSKGGSSSHSKSSSSYNQKTNSDSNSPLNRYANNPVIKAVEKAKKTNKDVKKYFPTAVSPADSPYLTDWEKMKMLGL